MMRAAPPARVWLGMRGRCLAAVGAGPALRRPQLPEASSCRDPAPRVPTQQLSTASPRLAAAWEQHHHHHTHTPARSWPTMPAQPPAAAAVAAATRHTPGTDDSWHAKITPDGPFQPERGRYRLYVGLFCPFAHRTLIVRNLKGLQELLPVTVVKPYPKGNDEGWPGWQFPAAADEYPGADPDPLLGAKHLHELYFKDDPKYKGRYSVPLLWDARNSLAVNNESLELLRDLQTAFDPLLPEGSPERSLTLYPEPLRAEIDRVGTWMQQHLNWGVYMAGFAESQAEYDEHVPYVFAALNVLERMVHANGGPYLLGSHLTELDVRMYTTLIRFDAIYVQHFKCNLGTIRHDYPQLNNWLKNLYWNVPAFGGTTNFKHIKENYTKSHASINPRAITPLGPWPNVEEGYEPDVTKVPVGGVKMPAVVELEAVVEGKAEKGAAGL